jgi:excisionase family DNA binding protein
MELTIKEYAARERVTERTVRQWIAKGAVDVRRTPGGRVRIPVRAIAILTLTEQTRKNAEECGSADE